MVENVHTTPWKGTEARPDADVLDSGDRPRSSEAGSGSERAPEVTGGWVGASLLLSQQLSQAGEAFPPEISAGGRAPNPTGRFRRFCLETRVLWVMLWKQALGTETVQRPETPWCQAGWACPAAGQFCR